MQSWIEFWNAPHDHFDTSRNTRQHYAALARDVLAAIPARQGDVLLDYGCGQALASDHFVAHGLKVLLYDKSRHYHDMVRRRYADAAAVTILSDRDLADRPSRSIDCILICSVVQYLAESEVRTLLALCAGKLKGDGALLLVDVVPPRSRLVADVAAILRAALRHGCFIEAVVNLARFFSSYRRTRDRLGLKHHGEAEMLALLNECGPAGARQKVNFGLNASRATYIAKPLASD